MKKKNLIRTVCAGALATAVAAAAFVFTTGSSLADPASARCSAPPVTFGERHALADHQEVTVRFTCMGARLAGTLYLPNSAGVHPAIVWVHGAGEESRLGWGSFTGAYVKAGLAFFSFDKRGVGESEGVCCPGDTGHLNLATADVVGAVSAIRVRRDIDATRVGLIGASQAGWIAPRAALDSRHVAFVVLAAPGVTTFGEEHAYERLTGGYGSTKPFPSKAEIARSLEDAGPSGYDPLPDLRRLNAPVLWLLGGRDQEIPLDQTLRILHPLQAAGKNYTIHVYPRANHGLFDVPPTDPRVLPDTLAWLRAHA